jgi:hypothetical protein
MKMEKRSLPQALIHSPSVGGTGFPSAPIGIALDK